MITSFAAQARTSGRQMLNVATGFWGACLVLVSLEATVGSNFLSGLLFFLSIPMLVCALTWVNKGIVLRRPRHPLSVVMLGVSVLTSSTLIVLVGLLAAANLKSLLVSA